MEKTERVVFIDYIRVIACFLVMLVHSSENFYAADSSGLASSVSMLANESNRFRSHQRTIVYDSIGISARTDEARHLNATILSPQSRSHFASFHNIYDSLLFTSSIVERHDVGTIT